MFFLDTLIQFILSIIFLTLKLYHNLLLRNFITAFLCEYIIRLFLYLNDVFAILAFSG